MDEVLHDPEYTGLLGFRFVVMQDGVHQEWSQVACMGLLAWALDLIVLTVHQIYHVDLSVPPAFSTLSIVPQWPLLGGLIETPALKSAV